MTKVRNFSFVSCDNIECGYLTLLRHNCVPVDILCGLLIVSLCNLSLPYANYKLCSSYYMLNWSWRAASGILHIACELISQSILSCLILYKFVKLHNYIFGNIGMWRFITPIFRSNCPWSRKYYEVWVGTLTRPYIMLVRLKFLGWCVRPRWRGASQSSLALGIHHGALLLRNCKNYYLCLTPPRRLRSAAGFLKLYSVLCRIRIITRLQEEFCLPGCFLFLNSIFLYSLCCSLSIGRCYEPKA